MVVRAAAIPMFAILAAPFRHSMSCWRLKPGTSGSSGSRPINQVFKSSEPCQRLAKVMGVGPLTSTALVAAVGDANVFKNGRHMAAWLGLVPRQHSTGGKPLKACLRQDRLPG